MSTEKIASQWLALKHQRDDINSQMSALAQELAGQLEHPDEGSKTHILDGYKVTVTARVNRRVDVKKWHAIREGIPRSLWPVREKLEADPKGCRYLAENSPETWAVVAAAITEKPGAPGIQVVEVSE
ncbi:MAG: hypothetical protein WC914_04480 [Proteiniphilum sp.]